MSDKVKTGIDALVERVSKARFDARRDLQDLGEQGANAPLKTYERVERSALAAERAEATLEAARRATDPARTVELAKAAQPGGGGVTVGSVRVTSEPRTYRDGGEHSFLADALGAQRGHNYKPDAAKRMAQHYRELRIDGAITEAQERALSVAGESGEALLPPAYLLADAIPVARGSRVAINTFRKRLLPETGITVHVPKIKQLTGGPAGQVQKPLAEVETENVATEEEESQVATVDADQDLARQLFERMGPSLDAALLPSLLEAVETKANEQAWFGEGSASKRELFGLYFAEKEKANRPNWATEETIAGLYKALAYARYYTMEKRKRPATHLFVAPTVLAWLESLSDEQKRPLVCPCMFTTADAAQQFNPDADYDLGAPVGKIGNLLIVEDPTIPAKSATWEHTEHGGMVVGRPGDVDWYEAPTPMLKVYEQAGALNKELAIRVQLIKYCAQVSRFNEGWSFISGEALKVATTPTI